MNKAKYLKNVSQDDYIFDDVIMLDDVDFLTKEKTIEIITRVKQGIKYLNDPDKWITWEECCKRLDEECFNDYV